jgi:hypothetical protein
VAPPIKPLFWYFYMKSAGWVYPQSILTSPTACRFIAKLERSLRKVKLGMPRSTLEHKIRALRIDKNRFKTNIPSENS